MSSLHTLCAPLLLLGHLCTAAAQQAPATAGIPDKGSAWTLRGGVGVAVAPKFAGSDKRLLGLLPVFEARYREQFFISTLRGAGYELRLNEQLSFSAALAPDMERRRAKDDKRLTGLGEVKWAPALRLGAELNAGPLLLSAGTSTRLGKGKELGGRGTRVEFDAGYALRPMPGVGLIVGASAQLMDGKLASALFGVTPAQAAASGLAVHQADAGLTSLGLFAKAHYRIDSDWSLLAKLDLASLRGTAASSPIVKMKLQPGLALMVSRAF